MACGSFGAWSIGRSVRQHAAAAHAPAPLAVLNAAEVSQHVTIASLRLSPCLPAACRHKEEQARLEEQDRRYKSDQATLAQVRHHGTASPHRQRAGRLAAWAPAPCVASLLPPPTLLPHGGSVPGRPHPRRLTAPKDSPAARLPAPAPQMFRTSISAAGELPLGVTLIDGYNLLHKVGSACQLSSLCRDCFAPLLLQHARAHAAPHAPTCCLARPAPQWRLKPGPLRKLMSDADASGAAGLSSFELAREELLRQLDVYRWGTKSWMGPRMRCSTCVGRQRSFPDPLVLPSSPLIPRKPRSHTEGMHACLLMRLTRPPPVASRTPPSMQPRGRHVRPRGV